MQLATGSGIIVEQRSKAELDALCDGLEHQGVIAEIATDQPTRHDLLEHLNGCEAPWLVLILDEIQDPHNLGACLRSADAAGVDAVVVPSDNSASLTPVVRKVASGAAETVALFRVPNLQRSLKQLQEAGVWVFGAAGEADAAVHDIDFRVSTAVVMGAEGKGLRRLTRERCDQLFRIPMVGTVESLNVSVATGVALFEVRRQRSQG